MNRLTKKKLFYLIVFIFFLFVFLLVLNINKITFTPTISSTATPTPFPKQLVKLSYVIDGDTIIVDGNKKIRYIGINTPELKTQTTPDECFAREALDENKKLFQNRQIFLEKDVSETDKYKRLLRYVWVGDPSTSSGEAIFVNDYLVRQGFAQVSTFPPDVKYQQQFLDAQKEAQENNRGLWKSCSAKK